MFWEYVAGALIYSGNQILLWDFPDHPVVKTLCFHCWGNEFNQGTNIPHDVQHNQKKKKRKKLLPDFFAKTRPKGSTMVSLAPSTHSGTRRTLNIYLLVFKFPSSWVNDASPSRQMGLSFIAGGTDRRAQGRIHMFLALSVHCAWCQVICLHYHLLILARMLRGRGY